MRRSAVFDPRWIGGCRTEKELKEDTALGIDSIMKISYIPRSQEYENISQSIDIFFLP